MIFNSLVFVVFFAAVYAIYLSLHRSRKAQNLLLLVASYVFYGYWDWRFLSLLLISTLIDYSVGLRLDGESRPVQRRTLLLISMTANLCLLGFFKYFNFFADNLYRLFHLAGLQVDELTLHIILPVGISFYTFQTMSYTIDIYRGRLKATRSLADFALFVSFFPQLVAGPIERAIDLLPQITHPRQVRWDQVHAGLSLLLWGYFKKMVVADNLARIANLLFAPDSSFHSLDLVIGTIAFGGQIYGDFSGYSDIARGLAKLMGFELTLNFRLPYFALTPSDFWERWHITLSSWLRDYLYIPLGGNRGSTLFTCRNLMLTMLLGGLWHGAQWNFVLWGLFHGTILILYRLLARFGPGPAPSPHPARILIQWVGMLLLTHLGWMIFRIHSLDQLLHVFTQISFAPTPDSRWLLYQVAFFYSPLILMQCAQHFTGDLMVAFRLPAPLRALLFALLLAGLFIFGVRESNEFIYFQF